MPGGGRGKNSKGKGKQSSNQSRKTISDEQSDEECNPCTECESDIYDHDPALQCDLCEKWYCNQCLGLSNSVYGFMNSSKVSDGIMWFCKHCRKTLPATKKILQRLDDLESKQINNEKQIKSLQKCIEEKSKTLQSHVPNDQSSNTDKAESVNVASIISQVLEEQQEREKRKLNIVCFDIPESEETSPETRREDDAYRIQKIIDEVMEADSTMTSQPIRLGCYNAESIKPTLVRFSVPSVENKHRIIESARTKVKISKQERCKDLFFQSDLTANQRKEAYLLRVERRKNKSAQSNADRSHQRYIESSSVAAGATGTSSDSFQK